MYPFSAIVGQDSMKLALVLNAINPSIGGVLIRGEKGTAKSTAVRALAGNLPDIDVVADCPYSCDPGDTKSFCRSCRTREIDIRRRRVRVVELPLNATEDMVIGGPDFSASIQKGVRVFQPGLMARANRGILYVDEVNLLADHLVDVILDVCASGENAVQREGISHRHAARFILVGTMNPEEGELRPQLLDRFGLCVNVHGAQDAESRVRVLQYRNEFDGDPERFCIGFQESDRLLATRIARARSMLPSIILDSDLHTLATEICVFHNVAGHRADIVIGHTARALAAFEGRSRAARQDVLRAALLAIPHRSRTSEPCVEAEPEAQRSNSPGQTRKPTVCPDEYPEEEPVHAPRRNAHMDDQESGPFQRSVLRADLPEAIFDIGSIFKVREIQHVSDKMFRKAPGKRSRTRSGNKKGKYVGSTLRKNSDDIALDATIRAAAPHQVNRKTANDLMVKINEEDIREKIRESRAGNFLLFVVDASGSMGAKGRMMASKGAIMSLLTDAYQKRDRVAMVSFRKQDAVVNLPPTSSIYRAGELLKELPVGGKTPLAAGLRKGQGVLRNVLIKDPTCRPILIVITDGKANESIGKGDPFWEALAAATELASDRRVKSIVVDAEEDGSFRYNLSARLAKVLKAEYVKIKDLRADVLLEIVRSGV